VRNVTVGPDVIQQLACAYTEQKPAAILLGWGINKWVNSPEMIRMIDALGALSGNIGISGGGSNHGFQTQRHFDLQVLAPDSVKYKREIPMPLLGRGILESKAPPIKMLWIDGSNPVISCPHSNKVVEALKSLEFLVVVDLFMTDTAELADIFLPTTTFLEDEDIVVSWGHNWIGPVNKVIEPLGETKSDLTIVQELSGRLGLESEMAGTAREWLRRLLKPMENVGLSVDRVMESPVRCPIAPMVAFEGKRFPTPSGRFEFTNHVGTPQASKHSFHLLSVLSDDWINSTVLENDHPEIPKALINPSVARERGIRDKARALITSSAGKLVVEINVFDGIRNDTIAIQQGTWIKLGGGVNQLTEDLISSSGGMGAYYSTMVDIKPLRD
jgi:anaerobic selenocysteine-containing dehydrogenase